MKIAFLAVRDTGGTAYTLAHAVNKISSEDQAVNIIGQHTFIQYPVIADMSDYTVKSIRDMLYNSDVIVFLDGIKPFIDKFHLTKQKLKDKKKIVLCMGSLWRHGRDNFTEQADKLFGADKYKVALGDPALFMPFDTSNPNTGETKHFDASDEKEVAWLPPVRSFDELESKFGIDKPDKTALEAFGVPPQRVIFVHAPTSELNKGSITFYRAATRAQQACPKMVFSTVRQQTWVTTLNIISKAHVLYDQAPPFPTTYGALSVEAAIFRLPSFSQVHPWCRDFFKRYTGLDTPLITFKDDEDLFKKTVALASDEKLRRQFGDLNYHYCRQIHDEKPVVDRLMHIIDETPT